MRTAIIHDWLITCGGAEKVLENLLTLYPDADLFALYDFLPADERYFISGKVVRTSFLQRLPFARSKYRSYLPLMPYAVEQFDLSSYDLIISNSHAVAKGVLTGPDQLHVSYILSPIRYAWDLTHQYLSESGLTRGLRAFLAKAILHYVRLWDARTGNAPDEIAAISAYIARRIRKTYGRKAAVIYPPVDVDAFELGLHKGDFYLTASRMVPYKRISLIVRAFARMPDRRLIVIGDGPDYFKIKSEATSNVTLMGYQPAPVLKDYLKKARAFIFAAEEDFGILPVEAQACGTPVIAYGRGGTAETVRDGTSGLFFHAQDPDAISEAISRFEKHGRFDPHAIRDNARRFSRERFLREFHSFVNKAIETRAESRGESTNEMRLMNNILHSQGEPPILKEEAPDTILVS
jgi:glycosyltransferase involved in cell wall biosynthesis